MNLQQYYSEASQKKFDDVVAFRNFLTERQVQRKQSRKLTKPVVPKKTRRTTNKQRREKSTPETKWLNELICPFVYAEKTPDGIRPSVTKESFIGRWNLRWGLPSLANYKLLDHFQSKETLYFMGQGWEKKNRTLVMIDIDVLKSKGLGTPEGARKFAVHLKTIWPDLYFEISTNNRGIHGYFILWKKRTDARRTNAALKRLEAWLRAEARKTQADIEQVEIKGTCLDLTIEGGLAKCVKFGVPAKLPRDVTRFAEWQQTTVLRVQDLESKLFDVVEDEAVISASVLVSVPMSVEPELVKVPMPMPVVLTKKKNAVAGSVSGRIISEEELASIPQYERLYREWVGPVGLKARKFSVTAHDFTVAMVILRHYKANPNADGSLPCRRVEGIWTALFDAGDIDRPWNHHRWKAIRDFLSAKGHIDWNDHRYEYGTTIKDNGRTTKKGIACKWSITDGYDWTLGRISSTDACSRGEASFVDTAIRSLIPIQGNGENLKPTPFPIRVELEQKFWFRAYEACEHLFAA